MASMISRGFGGFRSVSRNASNYLWQGLRQASVKRQTLVVSSFSTSSRWCAIQDDFLASKERVNTLKKDPGNMVKLQMYSLFKQASEGKCTNPKPGMLDMVGRAKWSAWTDLGDISKEDAMKQYIDIVNDLVKAEGGSVATSTPESTSEGVDITNKDGVLMIKLNRPAKKNAITWDMYSTITDTLNKAAQDDSVIIAAVTGTGDYFSSGNDLTNFTQVTPDNMHLMAKKGKEVVQAFVAAFIDFPKPLVGFVNGHAIGIPVTTLALYDAVYATDTSTYATPFTALGQSPEGCSSYLFPKIMGPAMANDVLLFGRRLSAEEAYKSGLISKVIPHGEFDQFIQKTLDQYKSLPPQSLAINKQLVRSTEKDKLHSVNEEEALILSDRWVQDECINALMNFMKRKK